MMQTQENPKKNDDTKKNSGALKTEEILASNLFNNIIKLHANTRERKNEKFILYNFIFDFNYHWLLQLRR